MGFKALLVGINQYESAPLDGCVNDVMQMQQLLRKRYGAEDADLRVLLDAEATGEAIVEGLRWLALREPGESEPVRLFQFSGHGTYIADENGDEQDGKDECLCPVDFEVHGPLRDDTMRELYGQFGSSTHLVLVMDCCHSGSNERSAPESLRDSRSHRRARCVRPPTSEHRRARTAAEKNRARRDANVQALVEERLKEMPPAQPRDLGQWVQKLVADAIKKFEKKRYGLDTVRGNIVLIASCRADQMAADTRFGGAAHGAMTYFLLRALEENPSGTYEELIDRVGDGLYEAEFHQVPQLECSEKNRARPFLASRTPSDRQASPEKRASGVKRQEQGTKRQEQGTKRHEQSAKRHEQSAKRHEQSAKRHEQSAERDEIAAVRVAQDVERDEIAAVRVAQDVERDEIAAARISQDVEQDEIATARISQIVERPEIAAARGSQDAALPEIATARVA